MVGDFTRPTTEAIVAILFISYSHLDQHLARAVELRLKGNGHSFKIPVATRIAGDWRTKLMNAQAESDAVIFLLSERALVSPYVLGQIGSARVYAKLKGQLILPVLVGRVGIPKFVSDLQCFELESEADKELDKLARELDEVLAEHGRRISTAPRIFISHRHKDEELAAALVSLLEAAFYLDQSDVRCTSVQPYALPPGAMISETLKNDINGAELVIGIIGPETSESRYVLFELGAAWARGVPTFPVLVRGALANDVPGPLSERHSISLKEESNCLQLVDDIAREITLKRRQGVTGKIAGEAKKLATLAGGSTTEEKPSKEPPDMKRMGQHILNYLAANEFTAMSFERVRERINPAYNDVAILELIDKSPDKFRRAKVKGGRPGIARI